MTWLVRGLTALVVVGFVYALWALTTGRTIENRASVEIAQPVDVVFPYLTEHDRIPLWLDDVVESRSLTGPGTFVGARSTHVIEVDGQRQELERKVTEYQENALLAVRIKSDLMTANNRYRVSPVAGGTRIDYDSVTKARGWVSILAPFFRAPIQEKLEPDLARLKPILEDPSSSPATG